MPNPSRDPATAAQIQALQQDDDDQKKRVAALDARVSALEGKAVSDEATIAGLVSDVATLKGPPPTISVLKVDPATIDKGGSATLTWATANADTITASGGWSGTKAATGSEVVTPTDTASFGLQCVGKGGTVTAAPIRLTVNAPAPPVPVPTPIPGPPSSAGDALALRLDFLDGKFLQFSEATGADIGSYPGIGFTQRCVRQVANGNGDYRDGFSVYFRPDVDGKRVEVVIEHGCDIDFGVSPPQPARHAPVMHAPGYTATISGGGLAAPVSMKVPVHYFGRRCRWQSAPRPIVRSYADLIALKAIFPLDKAYLYGASLPAPVSWRGPMDNGGLAVNMGTTGDRPDLGLVTEYQAAWLLTGDPGMEQSWRAGAEATGSMGFWVRDVITGRLVYPCTRIDVCYNDAYHGQYAIPTAPIPTDDSKYFNLDSAHMPSAAFIPWLLTDDPYYLEGAQATALYGVLETNLYRTNQKRPCVVNYVQPRGWAWNMRELFWQTELAPAVTPSWLQNRDWWKGFLPDNLAHAMEYVNATASPCTTVFGLVSPTSYFEPFMYDYIAHTFARAVWTGAHEDWRPFLQYVSRARMAMSDKSSGWDDRFQVPYLVFVWDARLGANANGGDDYGFDVLSSSNTPTSWGELWSCYCKFAPSGTQYSVTGWTDPATWPADSLVTLQTVYLPEARSALAALAQAGVTGAKGAHDKLKARMDRQFPACGGAAAKWAVAPP